MTIFSVSRSATIRSFGIIAALGLVATSFADKIYTVNKTRQALGPVVYDTRDVFPQINITTQYHGFMASENESKFVYPKDPTNLLKAGGSSNVYRTLFDRTQLFAGIDDTGWFPPDTDFAVGPNHVVTVVNSAVAFFTKTGVKQFQQNFDANGFFKGLTQTGFQFDPKAFYDPISQRFFVICLDGSADPSRALVAVSDNSDPNGNWFKYSFDASMLLGSNKYWTDYPGWGFGKDAIAISGNMFPVAGGGFGGTQLIVIPKATLLTGAPTTAKYVHLPSSFTVQISRTSDKNTDTIYAAETGGGSTMNLYAIKTPATNPVVSQTSVGVPSFSFPPGADSTGGLRLDTHGGRTYVATGRPGRLYAAHTIGLGSRTQVRWYEFDLKTWPTTGQPALRQSGNVVPLANQCTSNPSIAANKFGDISVMFNRSSNNIAADIQIASRAANDPLGTMSLPITVASSQAPPTGLFGRWGDYSAATVDPVDDSTFWGYNMTVKANGKWTTSFYKWTVTTGGAGATFEPAGVSTLIGNYVSGDLSSLLLSDNNTYNVASLPTPLLGEVAAAQVDATIPIAPGTVQQDLSVLIEARGPTTASGSLFLWNWSQSKYELAGSFGLTLTDKKTTVIVKPFAKFVDASGNVRMMVRAINPIMTGRPSSGGPTQFTFGIDQMLVIANFN